MSRDIRAGVGTKIEARAVKRIDESRRVADDGPAVAANLRARIWQRGKGVHVAFDHLRVAKNFAPDRMREEMRAQTFAEIRALVQLEDARIVNQPRTDIAALERNDPAPPAVAHQVIRRPVSRRAAGVGVIRKTFAPFVAVPIFHAREARPDRVDRMLGVLPKVAELAREHRGPAAGIDDPASGNASLPSITR